MNALRLGLGLEKLDDLGCQAVHGHDGSILRDRTGKLEEAPQHGFLSPDFLGDAGSDALFVTACRELANQPLRRQADRVHRAPDLVRQAGGERARDSQSFAAVSGGLALSDSVESLFSLATP